MLGLDRSLYSGGHRRLICAGGRLGKSGSSFSDSSNLFNHTTASLYFPLFFKQETQEKVLLVIKYSGFVSRE